MTEKREIHLAIENFYTPRLHFSQMVIRVNDLKKKLAQYYPEQFKTAAHGDWRENSPKDTLDNEWSLDTTQLNKLSEQLTRSVVIEDLDIETHEVVPGAKVILVNPHDKSEISLTMVSFTDLRGGYLSINSDAGKTLLGKMRADQVRLQKNGVGYYIFDILKPDETLPVDKLEPIQQNHEVKPADLETAKKPAPPEEILQNQGTTSTQTVTPPDGVQRPQINRPAIRPAEQKRKEQAKPLLHRDEERFNSLRIKVPRMGGKITNQTTSSRDLEQGKKETRSVIEFLAGGNRFKAELVTRPKVISTQYTHTKRQGTSAEVTKVYGDEEIKSMYVYKLDGNNWVLVDFQ